MIIEEYIFNKLKILIILFSSIYLSKYILMSVKTEIIVDNRIKFEKEDNIDFSKFSTTIKSIAIYNINNSLIKINKIDNDQNLIKYNIKYYKANNYFYTHLIYNNLFQKKFIDNNKVFRASVSLSPNSPILVNDSKLNIYSDYSSEKFYLLNILIIDWPKVNHKIENQFIFIDNFENIEKDYF